MRIPSALFVVFFSSWLWAQATFPEVTLSTRSELVLVPVVVTDNSGVHVAGLGREAFSIEDNKTMREIAVFEEIRDVKPAGKTEAEEQGIISNYSPADPSSRRLVVVVLDLVNTPFLSQQRAKAALLKFLATSLPSEEPIALFALTSSGLKQIHSFTTDTRALVVALNRVSGQISAADKTAEGPADTGSVTMPGVDQDANMLTQIMQDSDALYTAHVQRDATRTTLAALEQIAGAYAGIPGRKSVVWATGGFPFTLDDPHAFGRMGTEMVAVYENTWRALNSANIAVYPVNIDGLAGQNLDRGFGGMILRSSRQQARGTLSPSRSMPYDSRRERIDTMLSFANATGGKAFVNRNDIEAGFRDAIRDSRSYYLVGFYLDAERKSGWHKLKVGVGVPGSRVRVRDGFYVAAVAGSNDEARQLALLDALASPIDYTGIHFAVRVTSITRQRYEQLDPGAAQIKAPPEKKTVSFELMIPSGSIVIDNTQNNAVNFLLSIVGISKDGHITGDFTRKVKTTLAGDTLTAAQSHGIATKDQVTVSPDTAELRFIVRDNQNDRIGTLHVAAD